MCQEKKSTESNAHFLGWRKILMNAYYAIDEKLGVKIVYEAEDCGLEIREGKFDSAVFVSLGAFRKIRAKTVVDASGGFQADLSWLREYWGAVADNIIIRGPPYDKGSILNP